MNGDVGESEQMVYQVTQTEAQSPPLAQASLQSSLNQSKENDSNEKGETKNHPPAETSQDYEEPNEKSYTLNEPKNPKNAPINRALVNSPLSKKKRPKRQSRKGARIATTRRNLMQVEQNQEKRKCISAEWPGSSWIYGTVVGKGNKASLWEVEIDIFPQDNKKTTLKRDRFVILEKGEEEPEFDIEAYRMGEQEGEMDANPDPSTRSPWLVAFDDFEKLPVESQKDADVFRYPFKPGQYVEWEIAKDNEVVVGPEIKASMDVKLPNVDITIPLGEDDKAKPGSYHHNFFFHFMPSIEGHAAIIDKYHSNKQSRWYKTARDQKIVFHDHEADDPDHIVRTCYTLLIAAASFVQNGIENLWRSGSSEGLSDYPDFGKYVSRDTMKLFCAAAPYCWCDEKHWYHPRRDGSWDIFQPILDSFNEKRRKLLRTVLLLLDESMSGWTPKTSKFGGLPSICYEPRKPVPLGTMFRNSADALTGILAFQDVVACPEIQSKKSYSGEESYLPDRSIIPSYAEEVMRQADGAGIPENSWVGGDAYFRGIASALHLMKKRRCTQRLSSRTILPSIPRGL